MQNKRLWGALGAGLALAALTPSHATAETKAKPKAAQTSPLDAAPDAQRNRNVRVLRTTNKAQLNRYVPVVYDFKHVNPFAVLRFLRRPVQLEEGAIYTFVNPDGNSGKVIIAVPDYQVPYMNKLVETIDRPSLTTGDGTKRVYRQLKHRRASIGTGNGLLDDQGFIDSFGIYLTGDASNVVADPEQNAVFFEDAPSGSEYLEKALDEKLDKPTPQVVFNVKIYEFDSSNNARIGTDWLAWKNGPGSALLAAGGFAETGKLHSGQGSGVSVDGSSGVLGLPIPRESFSSQGTNFAYRYEVNSAFFDFLTVRGKARVLNSVKLAAISTRPARVTAGDEVLFYPVSVGNPGGVRATGDAFNLGNGAADDSDVHGGGRAVLINPSSPNSESVKESSSAHSDPDFIPSQSFIKTDVAETTGLAVAANIGLRLDLVPRIDVNGVDVAINGSLSDWNGFDDQGMPRVNQRQVVTNVRLAEGQEVVLGGLLREQSIKAGNRAPWLGKLPVIGYMFGGENTRKAKSEIAIVLQAERIERFETGRPGVTEVDQAVIRKAEGQEEITLPKKNLGFDQFGLDPEKK